ncbi:DUF5686 family protein [Filimonas effusa]|uniref:Carboxypeptidase-like regulatory domain-containing protein n=1 Tax=Filimonas effusa TaxID=2508721 RepID=A0A4Q1D5M7_9BACT|nr:DUF5686 family protein [Filimonas effusa]RXK82961.1 carboxypeptidase-like regulatory domain-containing protein [Filimonas effusa]
MERVSKLRLGIVMLLLMAFQWATGQEVTVSGIVRDASTKLPVQNVSVYFTGAEGMITGTDGRYTISSDARVGFIEFSIVGYKTVKRRLPEGTKLVIDVELTPFPAALNNVTVTTKKRAKYRNKDNPAVELIRQVIAHKDSNRIKAYESVSYEKYEKVLVSLNKISKKITDNKLIRRYNFVFDNKDSSKLQGSVVTPVFLEETLSDYYYRKDPKAEKSIVKGNKKVDFGEFVDMVGVSSYLNRLYEDINIYDNNISVLTNQFLSPIADMAPTFYMFYIRDTVELDGEKLVKMYFTPRNPDDLLFRGTMYITLDGKYGIQQIDMFISARANINFVRQLKINQEFERNAEKRYYLTKSSMIVDFGLNPKGGGIFGERSVSFKNFKFNEPIADTVFRGPANVILADADQHVDSFWTNVRHDTLTAAESKVYANIDSLRRMKSFRRLMDWGTFALAGYKQAGPIEVGPANTFYSFNPVEGFRLRAGFRTTPRLSKRYYFETYGAYGFKDERWKYFVSGTYSINNKSIYHYPFHYVRASFQRETKIPGQELQFVQEDNLLLSFKRGNNDKWLYNDIFRFNYVREFGDHISYDFGFKRWKQEPAGAISYIKPLAGGGLEKINDLTTTELSAEFRWAPHEQYYQGKLYRIPIINKYPIFTLRYIAGIKGLWGGEYTYHTVNLRAEKRFYVSQLGYTDVAVEGGKLYGKVPFPLLSIPRANQSYSLQLASFNLMNFMEFVNDQYASLMVDHYFNGFIFNKIPLLKKLKWREVIEGKLLYGTLRDENNPDKNGEQMKFPTTNGVVSTFAMEKTPYFEAGVGIANIFKLVRVDFIKRFTYLDHPEIAKWGIRARVKFDF